MAPSKRDSGAKVHRTKKFMLLERVENLNRMKYMIGSVIPAKAKYDPFSNHRPNLSEKGLPESEKQELESVLSGLWREEDAVPIMDITQNNIGSHSESVRLKITCLLKAYAKNKYHKEVEIIAGVAKCYTFDNPGQNLSDQLMKSAPWRQQLQRLVDNEKGKTHSFYLITGFYTCKDIEVNLEADRERGAALAVTIPASQIAGNPEPTTSSAINPEVAVAAAQQKKESRSATINQEVVFAVSYNKLDLTFEETEEPGFVMRSLSKIGFGKKHNNVKSKKIIDVSYGVPILPPAEDGFNPYMGLDDEEGEGPWDARNRNSLEFYAEDAPFEAAERESTGEEEQARLPQQNGSA